MDDFEQAYGLLNTLIAAYSARIATTSGNEVQPLRTERASLLAERDDLTPDNQQHVAAILREAPIRLRKVRAGDAR
ncbi:hypothetical protein [Streptomyces albidoflavus]|uniref:hypothetical protein n=1 Tax=Streptomyces albidoflavus TaxID=1886 RepID=UPI0033FF9AF7